MGPVRTRSCFCAFAAPSCTISTDTAGSSSLERPREARLPLTPGSGRSILRAKTVKRPVRVGTRCPLGPALRALQVVPGPFQGQHGMPLIVLNSCYLLSHAASPQGQESWRLALPCWTTRLGHPAHTSLRPWGKQLCLFLSPGPIPALFITEVFLQSSRSSAFMVGGSVHWLSNFTVGLIFPFIQVSVTVGALESQNPQAVRQERLRESQPGSLSHRWASGLTASSFSPQYVCSPPPTPSWLSPRPSPRHSWRSIRFLPG